MEITKTTDGKYEISDISAAQLLFLKAAMNLFNTAKAGTPLEHRIQNVADILNKAQY